jgi:hypothetical protein
VPKSAEEFDQREAEEDMTGDHLTDFCVSLYEPGAMSKHTIRRHERVLGLLSNTNALCPIASLVGGTNRK